jgi:hypothetical protein
MGSKKKTKAKLIWIKEKFYFSGKGDFKTFLGSEIVEYQDASGQWHKWPYLNNKYCNFKIFASEKGKSDWELGCREAKLNK